MTLWSDIAIQQFLTAIGKDLGPSGIDGELGDKYGVSNASVKPKKS